MASGLQHFVVRLQALILRLESRDFGMELCNLGSVTVAVCLLSAVYVRGTPDPIIVVLSQLTMSDSALSFASACLHMCWY